MATKEPESDPTKYPGFTGIGHPEIFTTVPPQPTESKVGQLAPEKVKEFFEQGFTVVENFFTLEEIEPCRNALRGLVDGVAERLYATGRIKSLYKDHGLEDRLLMLEKEWPGAIVLLLKAGKLTPELRAMYQSEKLLNVMEQLIGPEIATNPVWNIRPKSPAVKETDNPWHQDAAYFDLDAHETMIGTAWIAMVDVTKENGCMQFVKGAQKKGMVCVHTCGEEFYLAINEDELVNRLGADPEKDVVSCPVKAGGVIFFNNMAPHRSIPNRSNHIRWAIDLRYQTPSHPWGFYGLKNGILLRSPERPDLKPEWDAYDSQDRYDIQKEYEIKKLGHGQVDEFDTTVTGPWMEMWKIVGRNKHIDQFLDEKSKQ